MVVLKEVNLIPLKWRMARIDELYSGVDGVARVADILIERCTTYKLCLLPVTRQEDDFTQILGVFEGGEDVRADDDEIN